MMAFVVVVVVVYFKTISQKYTVSSLMKTLKNENECHQEVQSLNQGLPRHKGAPCPFDHLLCGEHIANLKEMLLTLSFEKAIFSNSKKRQFTDVRSGDTIASRTR